jgi:phenylalanyl-tRNA synthetase beta chain
MRIPLSWLAEFVSWSGTPAVLAERLTMCGLKVERIEEVGRLDSRIRVARLVTVESHPDADRVRVCRVDVGTGGAVTVVSGAPGLAAGQLVAAALPGARLAGGNETSPVTVRGVESAGVLCSEAELGLGDDASQVLVLPNDTTPGTPLAEMTGVADTVLEAEVTPNRGDWLSILGVAREVAALTGGRLRHPRPRPRESGVPAAQAVSVRVEAPDLCPRYCARVVRGVRVVPSPLWLRLRLRRAGMRSINAVVDATNYVMLERGQPLHAFDHERIAKGRIVVRRAAAGERLVTLDGAERQLEPTDLAIADASGPIALAGVMGGERSEVTEKTRVVVLESAFFAPPAVRRTSRRLALPSQAAYRFERRVDPAMVPEALDAVATLIARLAAGKVAPGIVEDAKGLARLTPPAIRLRPRRVVSLLGTTLARRDVARHLRSLGATTRTEAEALVVTPPSYRGDLQIEEDLIEEIARLAGYDRLPGALPDAPLVAGADTPERRLAARVRRLLVTDGLVEMVTLAFSDAATNRRLPGFVDRALAPIAVRNPLSSETGELRLTPLTGLLRALRLNADRGASFVGAFELGKGYGLDAQGARREPRGVAVLLWGAWPPEGAERVGRPVEFVDLKGVCENLFAGLGLDGDAVRWRPVGEIGFLHPGKGALMEVAGSPLGVAGALHPELAQSSDLPGEVWVAELDFAELDHYVPRRFAPRPLPRFPAVMRDLAVVVDEAFRAGDIIEEIRALGNPQIETVRLFDCYRGTPIAAGKKSLAFSIAYRASDRTLTDDEVNGLHAAVLERLAHRFTLEFRT